MKRHSILVVVVIALLVAPAAAFVGVCEQIEATWQDDTQSVRLYHFWEDNCAVDQISYSVNLDGSMITVDEYVSAPALAVCMCPYNGETTLGGLDPGEYTVEWTYHFNCTEDPGWEVDETCDVFTVTVPESAPGGGFGVLGFDIGGCGIVATAVPDELPPDPGVRSWSTVKGIFD